MMEVSESTDLMYDHVAEYVKSRICSFVSANPDDSLFSIAIPTGSTPLGLYSRLVEMCARKELSFQRVRFVNLDEYAGLPPTHVQSYNYFLHTNFLDHIDVKPENIHLLCGTTGDDEKECARHESEYRKGIELFIGGVGVNGHIAFNEPGSSIDSVTRIVELTESTKEANKRFFSDISEVPTHSLTCGISTILQCKSVLIMASGEGKSRAVQAYVDAAKAHTYNPDWPITLLSIHPNALLFVDKAATTGVEF